MNTCPYCSVELNGKYNFCLSCDRQVKCIHCQEFLVPNKARCFICGKPIESEVTSQDQINEFTLEEKHTRNSSSRSLKGRFSDVSFGQATALLAGLPISKPFLAPTAKQQPLYQQPALPQYNEPAGVVIDSPSEASEHIDSLPSAESTQPIDKIVRYFEQDGPETLVALVSDYKGETKKDQQQRFMLLYIHAYHHFFQRAIPEQKHITNALKNKNMFDSNTSTYFASVESKYLVKSEAGYRVNYDGAKEIERIINEIEDDNKKGFTDWDKSIKSKTKQVRLSSEVEHQINQWVDMSVDIGSFDIRSLKRPTNYTMFSMFIITKRLNAARAVKPVVIFQYLKRKYASIPVSQKSITNSLTKPYNASIFERTADGAYYLTQEGENKVKSWLQNGVIGEIENIDTHHDNGDADDDDEVDE